MNRIKYIISIFLLSVMTFLFLHSELDFFTPYPHHHSTHDFCDIIDGAKTENLSLDKSKIFSPDLYNLFIDITVPVFYCTQKITVNPQIKTNDTKLTILYNSLLI